MAKITRYDGNVRPFAVDALGTERTIFGDETQDDTLDANINTDWFRGWGIVGASDLPTKQDFNASMYTTTALVASVYQMGVPEWNDEQEYFIGSIANEGGVLYRSLTNNTGEQPSTDGGTNWEDIVSVTVPDASTTTKGIIEIATATEAKAGTSTTLAVTPKQLFDAKGSVVTDKSANYTAVLGDANATLHHPVADASDRTFTIPSNATVAYPIGTFLSFYNRSPNDLTITITDDTLELVGDGDTSDRTLAQYGHATAQKITSTIWVISGQGLS